MTDFINKIIMIVLIFILFACGGLLFTTTMADARAQLLIMNDVTLFLDKTTDKGAITESDLDILYIDVNSHGLTVDVDVERSVRTASKDADNEIVIVYIPVDDLDVLNHTDAVKVTVKEIGTSPGRMLAYKLIGVDSGRFEFSLAGSVS